MLAHVLFRRFAYGWMFLILVAGCARLAMVSDPGAQQGSSADLAFVGVDVLTMDERGLLRDQTVLVRDGRIGLIGARTSVDVPAGMRAVRAAGSVLMPGLIDAHIHLRQADAGALTEYLDAGITAAREMNGRPNILALRDRINAGEVLGPLLQVAAPTLANFSSPREGYPTPATAAAAQDVVRRFQSAGYDWIKIYTFLPDDVFDGVIGEAARLQIPVGGHVPVSVGLAKTLASGIRSIEHLTEYIGSSLTAEAQVLDETDFRSLFGAGDLDQAKLESFIQLTRNAGVWNVPTLIWFDRNMPAPQAQNAWSDSSLRAQGARNRRDVVRRLHNAGALLAIGTDSDGGRRLPASAIHDELGAMVEAGLTPYDALRAATVGGANLMGILDVTGTVAVGKRADLLLLPCDPRHDLSCLRRIRMVVVAGRVARN